MTDEVIATETVAWIPVAHTLELVRSTTLPPPQAVTSAFALVVDADRRTLLSFVDRPNRGWDLPGGHVEPGETPRQAAVRELAEETGFDLPEEQLAVFGWLRITLLAEPPADYRYPRLAYLTVFVARLDERGTQTTPAPDSECTAADWLAPEEVAARCGHHLWVGLHRLAVA